MNTPAPAQPKDQTQQVSELRQTNILDMALGFTATLRVFAPDSKDLMLPLLRKAFARVAEARSQAEFETIHVGFCNDFIACIQTAGKTLKNGRVIAPAPASYGHAAKMFDVCAKVWFYYCHLPTEPVAQRVCPYLHTGIDTPILRHLKQAFPDRPVTATTITDIDAPQYALLQQLATELRGSTGLNATEFDELLWRQLNR